MYILKVIVLKTQLDYRFHWTKLVSFAGNVSGFLFVFCLLLFLGFLVVVFCCCCSFLCLVVVVGWLGIFVCLFFGLFLFLFFFALVLLLFFVC